MDLQSIADIIKETKIGQGLKFLPRKMNDLTKSLQLLRDELAETEKSTARNTLASVLEELRRQKGSTLENYRSIKEDNNRLPLYVY